MDEIVELRVQIKGSDVPPNWKEHVRAKVRDELFYQYGRNVTVSLLRRPEACDPIDPAVSWIEQSS